MTTWRELEAALDDVAARGRAIRVWWRDDDAGRDHPALERLLELAERRAWPLGLAVVPLWLDDQAQARIAAASLAIVLQHGHAHADHASPGARAIELGGRDPATVTAELASGRACLTEAFGALFLAVLVPPWNRIDPRLIGHLAAAGFVGLSTFGRRQSARPAPGLIQINTHVDPVDWRGSRLFVGEAAALGQLIDALDLEEPIGLLSHHLVMDPDGWRFLDQLLGTLADHPAARPCAVDRLLEDEP